MGGVRVSPSEIPACLHPLGGHVRHATSVQISVRRVLLCLSCPRARSSLDRLAGMELGHPEPWMADPAQRKAVPGKEATTVGVGDDRVDSGIASLTEDEWDLMNNMTRLKVSEDSAPRNPDPHGLPADDGVSPQVSCLRVLTDVNDDGDNLLHQAIIHEFPDVALEVIKLDTNKLLINSLNDLIQTPLHLAIITSQLAVVSALVYAGGDTALRDGNGNTAWHLACTLGREDCLRHMAGALQRNARPLLELYNYHGLNCLHLAVLQRDITMVELLLQLGVNLKSYESRSGRTALHLATELHEPAIVDRLVCYGADLNARTFSGCTPLHLAVGLGDEGTSVLLCHLGANLHVRNGEDDSPMDLAETFPQMTSLFLYDDIRIARQKVC
uniref:NFKB inhibitor epsilon n=1 Tax=Eptatretus burgeri TaxID=7764 RepID=A0A8C4QT36_EPTBU